MTESAVKESGFDEEKADLDRIAEQTTRPEAMAQILGVAILEFGVIFHSVVIGLTLAVAGEEFNTLFVVVSPSHC